MANLCPLERPANVLGTGEGEIFCQVEQVNIKKARSFFMFGSIGVYQGDFSPLSAQSVVEVCVMLVLMYGSENWILNVPM